MARRIKSVAGLDAEYLEQRIRELENGETVYIYGCEDEDSLLCYLDEELRLAFNYVFKDCALVLVPFE